MPTKKLNLKEALERERFEPELKGRPEGEDTMEKIDQEKVNDPHSFKVRLKATSELENIKPDVEKIELGMTPDEVIKIAGTPSYIVEWYAGNLKYNYGNVWVVMESGAVSCLVRSKHFEEYWGRGDYERENPEAIIK